MSLTFTVTGAAEVPVQGILDATGLDGLVFVRNPAPPADAPFPETATHLAWRGKSARPIEIARSGGDLKVRLLTNGANADSSRLGFAVIAAAARQAGAPIVDEESQTFDDADALLAHYDDAWCEGHATFGLHAMADILKQVPQASEGFFVMPTNEGVLTVAPWNVAQAVADPDATFDRFVRRAWVSEVAAEAPLFEKCPGVLARRVDLGERVWIDNTARWCEIEGVSGMVSRENLTSTIGEGVEKIDDGCVVLPALTPERREEVRQKLASTSINDEEAWRMASGLPREASGAPIEDLQSVSAHAAAGHHEDQVKVFLLRQKKLEAASPVDLKRDPPADRRQEILTAETVRVGKRLLFTEGSREGETFDVAIVLGPKDRPVAAFPTGEVSFELKGQRRMGCAALLVSAPVLPGLLLIALFGGWGLVAAALMMAPALLLALVALIKRDRLVLSHDGETHAIDVDDLGDEVEREAALERLCVGRAAVAQDDLAAKRAAIEAAVEKMEAENCSEEARARKARSRALLHAQGVPTIAHLPPVSDAATAVRREPAAVARRAIVLGLISTRAQGLPREQAWQMIRELGLEDELTPDERSFMLLAEPDANDNIQFSWRSEACNTLLWALGKVDALPMPTAPNPDVIRSLLGGVKADGPEAYVRTATLRPQADILDAADLVYRIHWAVRDASLKQAPIPAGLNPGVVEERHYGLNWLIGDDAWDDVSTHT